ncbi:hypothetical protein MCEMSHM24_03700 [Comamonadaceae bacterium]
MRLFGTTRAQRTIVPSDFHVPAAEAMPLKTRALSIDVRLNLPELVDGSARQPPWRRYFAVCASRAREARHSAGQGC